MMKEKSRIQLQGWSCVLGSVCLLVWAISLQGCTESPHNPPLSYLGQEFNRIVSESKLNFFDRSGKDDLRFLRRNEKWLVDEYRITNHQTLSDLYRVLALREAVWQLRVMANHALYHGPTGHPYLVADAIVEAEEYKHLLPDIIAAGGFDTVNLAAAMRATVERYSLDESGSFSGRDFVHFTEEVEKLAAGAKT